MSTLKIADKKIMMANLNGQGDTPCILSSASIQQITQNQLDETDGVYVGYGYVEHYFPYLRQDRYDRKFSEKEIMTVELENEFLRACFLPTLGGRLWSLYDKKAERELLLTNDCITFGNLGIRDAWFCGGVEFNCGVIGHSPFTCSPVHTATLKTDDGTPVLRFYEFERIRRCIYQIDAWLPDGSKRLFISVRIFNPNQTVVPSYWWSNIAVEEYRDGRVFMPATQAYTNAGKTVTKVRRFKTDERDITYPAQTYYASDYFWCTKNAPHKFVCAVDGNGYGLLQSSSSRQVGRKLFVWGQHHGSENWQKHLKVGGRTNRYIEIQAGLGQTQYETVPMAPGCVWQWVESYGAIELDRDTVHAEHSIGCKIAEEKASEIDLEQVLNNATHIKKSAEKVILRASGWGALEKLIKQDEEIGYKFPEWLDFGETCEEQSAFVSLIKDGTVGIHDKNEIPKAWINGKDYVLLLQNACKGKDSENWYAFHQLGASLFNEKRYEEAESALLRSLELAENPYTYLFIAVLCLKKGDRSKASYYAEKIIGSQISTISLVRNAILILSKTDKCRLNSSLDGLSDKFKYDGVILAYYINLCLERQNLDEAERLFENYYEQIVTDICECDISVTELYRKFLQLKTGKDDVFVPDKWNYEMN